MTFLEIIARKLKKARKIKNERGWHGVEAHIKQLFFNAREKINYQKWIEHRRMTDERRAAIRREIAALPQKPLLSVVLPVYNVEEKWLRACLESVFRQLYENWELCIADDKSPSPHIHRVLEEYAARDERVKVVFRAENGHISAASNSALELATGEFCVLLDHDDELTEDALFHVADELKRFPETDFLYSDEDMIDERGVRYAPKFKPDFSRDLLYSLNLITHLSVYRTSILRKIGGFRLGVEGSQDYDLALRFIEQIDEKRIRHIPHILYHWRAISGSVALSSDEKPYAFERARQAIRDHLERCGKRAHISETLSNFNRVHYELPEIPPRVSLILTIDENVKTPETEVETFFAETAYPNFEIVAVCAAKHARRLADFSRENFKIVERQDSTQAANLNRAAAEANGEILCFVDAVLRPRSTGWLEELASFAAQTEIGAVGGKIISANGTLMHAGLVIGFNGTVGSAHKGLPLEMPGYFLRAQVINNFSAVALPLLTTRRELFENLGSFDAENLPESLFDADFCLRLREKNLRVVFTPYAELTQTAKNNFQSQPSQGERDYFRRRWQNVIERDPFYNANLSLEKKTFAVKI